MFLSPSKPKQFVTTPPELLFPSRYGRYIHDIFGPGGVVQAPALAAGNVYMVPLQIIRHVILEQIGIPIVTAAGNCRMALYTDNGDQPDGGDLLVETGSLALAVGKVESAISLELSEGLYWLAVNFDAAAVAGGQYIRPHTAWLQLGTLTGRTFNNGAGYGAFDNPCPVTAARNDCPDMFVVVTTFL